jgi:hypothetical protein
MASEECQAHTDLRQDQPGKPLAMAGGARRTMFFQVRRVTRTGANGVKLCFSAASISTAKQSAAVMNISMNTA